MGKRKSKWSGMTNWTYQHAKEAFLGFQLGLSSHCIFCAKIRLTRLNYTYSILCWRNNFSSHDLQNWSELLMLSWNKSWANNTLWLCPMNIYGKCTFFPRYVYSVKLTTYNCSPLTLIIMLVEKTSIGCKIHHFAYRKWAFISLSL